MSEIAWAAGFFDGEGGTYFYRRSGLRLQVSQRKTNLLHRFREAVNLGRVSTSGHSGMWKFRVSNFDEVTNVLKLLWPWIGKDKREQAQEATTAAVRQTVLYGRRGALRRGAQPRR